MKRILSLCFAAALVLAACDSPTNGDQDRYGISVSVSGTHTFADAVEGYTAITPLTVTVTNTGNQATGGLTVALSGTNAANYFATTPGDGAIAGIPAGGTATFTIGPKTGLTAGTSTAKTYEAIVTVSGGNGIGVSFPVSFTVNPRPEYGISLSETGTYTFTGAAEGYAEAETLSVTVSNIGTNATGQLTAFLTGTNAANYFTLSTASISSIAVGGTATFTVRPKTGLGVGTYTATITVNDGSGGNGIGAGFYVSFTVSAEGTSPVYSMNLSETGTYTFSGVTVGYTEITPRTVTISNTGNQPTGSLFPSLLGTNAANYFTLSTTSISSIPVSGTGTFTVRPKTGLGAGIYTATVIVSGQSGIISRSFIVSITVSAGGTDPGPDPAYGISLSETGTYTFPVANYGYTAVEPLTVTVTNTGTSATGMLTVALSGADESSFNLGGSTLTSIQPNASRTFTVGPKTGLAKKTHTTGVLVYNETNNISEEFNLSFTVGTFSIGLDKSSHTFPGAGAYYEAVTHLVVTVSNTGDQPTGPLNAALTGDDAGSFTLNGGDIAGIPVNGTQTFTVGPNTGLPVGTYTAAVTVGGGNGIAPQSIGLSFTVAFRLTSVAAVETYLATAAGGTTAAPIPLPTAIEAGDWESLLAAVNTAQKYVALDLSANAVIGIGTEFDPGAYNTGEQYVVSLVLPDTAESTKAVSSSSPLFQYFTALKEVTGANIKTIGDSAFYYRTSLTSVNFPEAASIGSYAFQGCTGLTSISFPEATTIWISTFSDCSGLTSLTGTNF
ncbi:MAG: leucine-rich repeat domain-containing protein, partial [Treponema sp.]|nr:leucine-rich repeat domain-containing protein [Treponema sp.]